MNKETIQVGDTIEIEIPHSSERYKTVCIYIDAYNQDEVVIYGADGSRCKLNDVVAITATPEEFEGTLAERTREVF